MPEDMKCCGYCIHDGCPDCHTILARDCPRYITTETTYEQSENKPVGAKETNPKDALRTFDTGATRDNVEGKLDYMKALSPIVLRRYVQYLDKHRLQPDGSLRDFDNWKQGIPQEIYHSSGGRHFFDTWLLSEGYETEDNHGPVTDIEDTLCAEIFNKMGRLHEILKAKLKHTEKRDEPIAGGY